MNRGTEKSSRRTGIPIFYPLCHQWILHRKEISGSVDNFSPPRIYRGIDHFIGVITYQRTPYYFI